MNKLLWFSIGSAVVGTALLLTGKRPARKDLPGPAPQYGEAVAVDLPVPSGWRRATNSEVSTLPELQVAANALRNTPGFSSMVYGTLTPLVASDGKTYATWIEQHYHPPGGPAQPWGLHHGVTILASTAPGVGVGDDPPMYRSNGYSYLLKNERLAQGSAPPPDVRLPFDVIVLAAEEYQPDLPGYEVLHVPLNDSGPPPTHDERFSIYDNAARIARRVRAGKRVLVTCWQGRNRSGVLSGLALVNLGVPGVEAAGIIRRIRNGLTNPYFYEMVVRSSK